MEWLKQCDSLLAEYSTSYQVTEDVDEATVKGRIQNIKNGAEKLDGIVLMPNEVLSCYETLSPFTGENGYDIAATYVQGRVVESMGGGVCQLSTTLYNACLFAELEVVERSEHSMTVGYIPLSRDAAIAGENKDLKIKNNTDAPVYIEAKAEDGLVTFLIYGKAKKAGREVRLQTVYIEVVNLHFNALRKGGLVQIGGCVLREAVSDRQNLHCLSSLADAAPMSGMVMATMGRK